MKMKEFGPGAGASLVPPLDPPMIADVNTFVQSSVFINEAPPLHRVNTSI